MKKINLKFKTEFSGGFNKFITNSGNGKNEPTFKVVNGKPVIVVDKKTGEKITFNRYEEIQKFKNTNDYKRMLESGADPVIYAANSDVVVDTTEMGTAADLLSAQQNANANGFAGIEDLLKKYNDYLVYLKQQQENKDKENVSSDVKEEKKEDK